MATHGDGNTNLNLQAMSESPTRFEAYSTPVVPILNYQDGRGNVSLPCLAATVDQTMFWQ